MRSYFSTSSPQASSCAIIVAIVSPSWVKVAAINGSSSLGQHFDIEHAIAEIDTTSSHDCILSPQYSICVKKRCVQIPKSPIYFVDFLHNKKA